VPFAPRAWVGIVPREGLVKLCIKTTDRRHGLSKGQKHIQDTTWVMYWMGRDFSSIDTLLLLDQDSTEHLGNSTKHIKGSQRSFLAGVV